MSCAPLSQNLKTLSWKMAPRMVKMWKKHYIDVVMTTAASQITSLTVVYSTVYSDADQRKHQSSASLAFVWEIHRDRWIPRTKGQLRGKCFHLMTSSWFTGSLCTNPMNRDAVFFFVFFLSHTGMRPYRIDKTLVTPAQKNAESSYFDQLI